MKAKIVYGSPCSGKTTYVRNNAGDCDFIFDYDRLLLATTDRTLHLAEKHALHWLILELRQKFVECAKSADNVEIFWLVCSWNTDYIKTLFEGIDTEEIFIEATKEECYRRLENDETRPDKEEWKTAIDEWFEKHVNEEAKSLNKFWNWAKNEETGERTLRLDGVICDDDFFAWLFDGVSAKAFREELNSGEGDISVWIHSEGGDCFAAAAIYNMLKEYGNTKGLVTVKIDGLAASAASVVAMAGDVVEISPVGIMMIHNPWTGTVGDAEEFRSAAQMLDDVKETIINAYQLKTKLPREQLAQMMSDETWLHAKKAVELHFADKIMYTENQTADSGAANISSRRQVMNCMTNAFKAKLAAENKTTAPKKRSTIGDLRKQFKAKTGG